MATVAETLTWAAYEDLLKAYLSVDGDDYDTLLEALLDSALERADSYLNNPFEEIVPTVYVLDPAVGDTVTVNGQTYTAAAATDEDELEFALGATDTLTAGNLAALINSTTLGGSYGTVGVSGVRATNTAGTITFTRRAGNPHVPSVSSSDEDTLLVRNVRTDLDIPDAVIQWVMQDIHRHFENREALIQSSVQGKSMKMYLSMKSEEGGMTTNWDLLRQFRLEPGF